MRGVAVRVGHEEQLARRRRGQVHPVFTWPQVAAGSRPSSDIRRLRWPVLLPPWQPKQGCSAATTLSSNSVIAVQPPLTVRPTATADALAGDVCLGEPRSDAELRLRLPLVMMTRPTPSVWPCSRSNLIEVGEAVDRVCAAACPWGNRKHGVAQVHARRCRGEPPACWRA